MTIAQLYNEIGGDLADMTSRIPKENLIIKFIKKYAESDETAKLAAAFRENDHKRVFEISHNLKGMSANLSLKRITENISNICEAVRHGEPETDISDRIRQAEKDHELLVSLAAQL